MPVFTQQSESKLSLQSLLKRHVNPGGWAGAQPDGQGADHHGQAQQQARPARHQPVEFPICI